MVSGNDSVHQVDKATCDETYELVRSSDSLVSFGANALTLPSAKRYVERLLREAPVQAKCDVRKRLAVVTGVAPESVGYHIAEELALQAEMDIVLMGRNAKQLQQAANAIMAEARKRSVQEKPNLYRVRINGSSLRSVALAADDMDQISYDKYGGRLHVLVNQGNEPISDGYGVTEEGVEVNMGRHYLAPRLLTDLLLPLLRAAATKAYKPRVVQQVSLGHCQGSDFDPDRLRKLPSDGGAPDGVVTRDDETGDLVYAKVVGTGMDMYHRGKMALIADTLALAKEEPMLAVTSYYTGEVAQRRTLANVLYTRYGSYTVNLSPSQAARSALRAALGPSFNTREDMQGLYLHYDGQPWTICEPSVINPDTGLCYTLDEYSEKVRAVGDELCGQLMSDNKWDWELCLKSAESSSFSLLGDLHASLLDASSTTLMVQ